MDLFEKVLTVHSEAAVLGQELTQLQSRQAELVQECEASGLNLADEGAAQDCASPQSELTQVQLRMTALQSLPESYNVLRGLDQFTREEIDYVVKGILRINQLG